MRMAVVMINMTKREQEKRNSGTGTKTAMERIRADWARHSEGKKRELRPGPQLRFSVPWLTASAKDNYRRVRTYSMAV